MTNPRVRRLGRVAGVLLLIGALAAGLATPVRADVSFSVTPGLVDLAATPGATGTHDLTVRNTGDKAVTLAISIEPTPGVAPERLALEWLSVSEPALEIEAGAVETVTVRIAIPHGIDTGGYYARVSLTTLADNPGANAAAIAAQLVVGFLITVDGRGELVRSASIGRIAPVLEMDGRIGFRAELVNDGNVHLIAPTGRVVVEDASGAAAGSLEFPGTTPLLPGTTGLLSTQGSLPLAAGEPYRASATFSWLGLNDPLTATVEFTNEPMLAIEPATVCENLDRGPTLSLTLTNSGTLGLQPLVQLGVVSDVDGPLGSAPVTNGELLWPGESRTIAIDYPERLASGTYRVVASVLFDPLADPTVVETTFQIGGLSGDPVPLCSTE